MIEYEHEERMKREEAAKRLHEIADSLARHNEVPFEREGLRYTVDVPAEVTLKVEIDVGADKNEIEVEISW